MDCAGRTDSVNGLRADGFVYVNVLWVVIVLVIVALYFCD